MAYAAIVPKTSAMNVEMRQMPIELTRDLRKSSLLKICA